MALILNHVRQNTSPKTEKTLSFIHTRVMVLVVGNHQADVVEEEVLVVQEATDGEPTNVVDVIRAQIALDLGGHGKVIDDPVVYRWLVYGEKDMKGDGQSG